ncbi:MAG: 5-formyltetrahydrofolate cyclo-ligase [Acidimicrobiales bacterium]|nr:5-formyltetrahydrofolate cyclo-ligase [Acidimicrobiales bacterium]MXX43165.1 5-formyltetrahydrofolate cyclo-ligase [Acidimicrobiales bacterium]MXY02780.1 5-formyltetrahydrofolate cyclo-ligase [Acidimicrobiales bacterium]MXZ14945.1 5-formyltetrahydrofolate cyclo-ligase [Acidimicrobiales bacterium]MYB82072.1 5-formyltetrahydrofolate cyclo-ligase [Acidimicrobiales bacterium]
MSGVPGRESSKADWRRWIRDHRRPVSAEVTVAVVAGLRTFIEAFDERSGAVSGRPVPPGANLILFYRAMANELSLDELADGLGWQRFAVTRTPPDGPLTLHPAVGAMEQHRYGFPQPTADAFELQPRHISLALVPGVAFDRHGTRLGHGAGYFDELLARLPEDCPRVGVARRDLVFERLPSEPHDVAMTHIATEDGVTAAES